MSSLNLTAEWVVESPLHVGTGFSREGVADRLIRLDPKTKTPILPGDAVKGAVRGTAERVVRWLAPATLGESEDHSLPSHPALGRIFSAVPGKAFYRFFPGVYLTGGEILSVAGTEINDLSGAAEDNTLRTIQYWSCGSSFRIRIAARGGDWAGGQAGDRQDLVLLVAALIATDAVGGHKGTGLGCIRIQSLSCDDLSIPELTASAAMTALRKSLLKELPNG